MGEYKLGDPSLPFRTSFRPTQTIPLRRSTRPKKPPERFPSTQVQMEKITRTEVGDGEKSNEGNQSSAKIKLIRKFGKWVMHNDRGGTKAKRLKINRHGENETKRRGEGETNGGNQTKRRNKRHEEGKTRGGGETKKYRQGEDKNNNCKGNGHAGAQSQRNVNNNSVPPVPAEETVDVELLQHSPESFDLYLDHDYAIPRSKGVLFKRHLNVQSATQELDSQNKDDVEIIWEIPADELKINQTEMKEEIIDLTPQSANEEMKTINDDEVQFIIEIPAESLKIVENQMKDEIEDLAEAGIASVSNGELSTTEIINNHANVAKNIKGGCYLNEVTGRFQNIVKEESETDKKDEVQTISETDESTTVQNVNTESNQALEYPDEVVKSGSLGETGALHQREGVPEVVTGAADSNASGLVVRSLQILQSSPGGEGASEVGAREAREEGRHGVEEEPGVRGVHEAGGRGRQGGGVVGDVGCCGACTRNDKIKIKMEIEMNTNQFLQVAKELPNIVTSANVNCS